MTKAERKANKKAGGAARLAAFHPNLFAYADDVSQPSVPQGEGAPPMAAGSFPPPVPASYVALGSACVSESPLERPSFSVILRLLDGIRAESCAASATQWALGDQQAAL